MSTPQIEPATLDFQPGALDLSTKLIDNGLFFKLLRYLSIW